MSQKTRNVCCEALINDKYKLIVLVIENIEIMY